MVAVNVKYAVRNQDKIFNILKQAKINNRLSHAYLFYGDEGVGKKEMAYALACLMYCPNDGCLECSVCKSILTNQHMNVDYIGIEDTKTMISKDQITQLQGEFSKTSLTQGSRIYIVDGIDTASVAAQNSLLKFIEEPINSEPTIGIFIAKDLSNVVSTIVSRCSLQHFKALPLDKIVESFEGEYDKLDCILAASLTCNPEEVRGIIENESFRKSKDLFFSFLELSSSKDGVLFYLKNIGYYSKTENLIPLLQWLLSFLEDVSIVGVSDEGLILTPLYDKIYMYKNKNTNIKRKIQLVLDAFNKLKYNISAKNIFHELIVKFVE